MAYRLEKKLTIDATSPRELVATKSYPPEAFPKSNCPYVGAVLVPVPPFPTVTGTEIEEDPFVIEQFPGGQKIPCSAGSKIVEVETLKVVVEVVMVKVAALATCTIVMDKIIAMAICFAKEMFLRNLIYKYIVLF